MTAKLNRRQAELVIGVVLYSAAVKVIWKLVLFCGGHGKL